MSQASGITHVVPSQFSCQAALMHATMSATDDLGLPTAFLAQRYHPFDHRKGQDPATSLAGGLRHATTKLGQAFCLLKTPLEFDDLISQQQGPAAVVSALSKSAVVHVQEGNQGGWHRWP